MEQGQKIITWAHGVMEDVGSAPSAMPNLRLPTVNTGTLRMGVMTVAPNGRFTGITQSRRLFLIHP